MLVIALMMLQTYSTIPTFQAQSRVQIQDERTMSVANITSNDPAFWQDAEQYGFGSGEEAWVTDRDAATRLVFGTIEGTETLAIEGQGRLTEILKAILPLPCLWYGLNYV